MLNYQAPWRTASGFTLIELMIVVSIIGILSAVAIPNYVRFTENAREASVKSACHTVQLAAEAFATQNDGFYAPNILAPSVQGETMIDLLPGGVALENVWTGVRTEPRDGAASQPGEVGFTVILTAGVVAGYSIDGYGRNAVVLTVSNGS